MNKRIDRLIIAARQAAEKAERLRVEAHEAGMASMRADARRDAAQYDARRAETELLKAVRES